MRLLAVYLGSRTKYCVPQQIQKIPIARYNCCNKGLHGMPGLVCENGIIREHY